jgi:hypothetical protein
MTQDSHTHVLRMKRLQGRNIIEVVSKHNCRELPTESHIDPDRTKFNFILRGADTAAGIAGDAQSLMDDAKVKKLKKTAVMGLELIFSLPNNSTIEHRRYFEDATKWAENYFKVPAISSIVHLDEAAPHCHVILLPLVDGHMVGSDLFGGKTKLIAHQLNFHDNVGKAYGLKRAPPKKRLSAFVRDSAIKLAYDVLEANSGLNGAIIAALLEPHRLNPEPILLALNIKMPMPEIKAKSSTDIFIKKVKPDKPIGIGKRSYKPIGLDDEKNELSLSCVGMQIISPLVLSELEPEPKLIDGVSSEIPIIEPEPVQEYHRESDSDQSPESFNEITGEFIKRPVKLSIKPAIRKAVDNSLKPISKARIAPRPTYHSRN